MCNRCRRTDYVGIETGFFRIGWRVGISWTSRLQIGVLDQRRLGNTLVRKASVHGSIRSGQEAFVISLKASQGDSSAHRVDQRLGGDDIGATRCNSNFLALDVLELCDLRVLLDSQC